MRQPVSNRSRIAATAALTRYPAVRLGPVEQRPEAAKLGVGQEAEGGGDVGDGVFVDAMEADQRVEDQEPRLGPETPRGADRSQMGLNCRKKLHSA